MVDKHYETRQKSHIKELEAIFKDIEKQGWRIIKNNCHWRLYPPDVDKDILIVSSTPRPLDETIKKIKKDLEKRGARLSTGGVSFWRDY